MIARGKRRAERGASPLGPRVNNREALKERNNSDDISHFQCSLQLVSDNQGRRASRLPLAIIFRAVGAAPDWIPTLSEAKPFALLDSLAFLTCSCFSISFVQLSTHQRSGNHFGLGQYYLAVAGG